MNRFIAAFLVLLFIAAGFAPGGKLKINGVWKVVEVQTVQHDQIIASLFPTESQVIFTQNNYSFCWTNHRTPIRSWNLPDSIKLARSNQSIINTGTFGIEDSTLITKALFAMHPMFVNGEAKFKCSFIKDTLILTGISVFSSDNIPNPVYANGAHFVTKLIKTAHIK